MIFSSIDIGSNAVRLLLANVFENTSGKIIASKASFVRVPIRLGEDVFSHGSIKKESEERLIKTLNAFKDLIEVYDSKAYLVCATAAMREAYNSDDIVKNVWKNCGMQIHIIDGIEEAKIIRMAGESIPYTDNYPLNMFIDVGGGSTEISVSRNGVFENSHSFQLGTLRLLNHADKAEEWEKLNQWLSMYKAHYGKIALIGSGGNINKLTKLFGSKTSSLISREQLSKAYKKLEKLSFDERMAEFNLRPDRADVIVPAAKLFLYIMNHVKASRISVPKFGLADGIVCKLYAEYQAESVIRPASID